MAATSPTPPGPVGVIRVLTSADPEFVATHGRVMEQEYGFATVSRAIPDQPHGIHDEESERRAEPKIVALAEELVADGARAVVISCAADPALEPVRRAVPVPVIGAGSAAAGVALGLGTRVGVIGITEGAPPAVRALLGERFVGAERPAGVRRTTDLLEPAGRGATVDSARLLVDAGADVLLLACTGLTTIGIGAELRERFGVPVVDAVRAAGLLASSL
ncbi:aspartate/glutamate racemase family protein [Streptomyces millisiae]|uniref:Aspartate/glutamate racemase family protein n=1 Tax=Streptomyces millisiae TaxID=3075542 RepID=A0ABU2LN53_9ACTN|nr:aspartate/glutamate racemase family protein [Streptomyces sp. DSM 44918]MDT0318708.1 aspartate/glutamate racemase family protein [Streptomyces sp. DSM 44918]